MPLAAAVGAPVGSPIPGRQRSPADLYRALAGTLKAVVHAILHRCPSLAETIAGPDVA